MKWVDGSYENKKGDLIRWIVPEGGSAKDGVAPSTVRRIFAPDSDLESLKAVAEALTPQPKAYFVAVSVGGTFQTLEKEHTIDEIKALIASGSEVQVHHDGAWKKPSAVGIKVLPPPPADNGTPAPPPPPADKGTPAPPPPPGKQKEDYARRLLASARG